MSEQDDVNLNTSNETTEEVDNTEDIKDDSAQDDSEDVNALIEKNKKLFERAKKAEAEARELKNKIKPPEKKPQTAEKQAGELSAKDILVLSKSSISEEEDIDEVLDFIQYRKSKGESLTVSQALGNGTLKAILADKAEKRRVAEVTNTSGSRRVTAKISGETLLTNAQTKGVVPESDDQMSELVRARIFRNKK